ncbi:MAG: hypothetical protein FWH33_03880 [Oscillospiraceae bacterium]|nr:hypothetical protein [Oscillospiraceae bacterium]
MSFVLALITLATLGCGGCNRERYKTPYEATDMLKPAITDQEPTDATAAGHDHSEAAAVEHQPTEDAAAPQAKYETGMFDPNYAYNKMPIYKVTYLTNYTSASVAALGENFPFWAMKTNCEFSGILEYPQNIDALIDDLPELCEEYDGLIIDIFPESLYDRVSELLNEQSMSWMAGASKPIDCASPTNQLLHPYVDTDMYNTGALAAQKLLDYKNKKWPDTPIEAYGWIILDMSSLVPEYEQYVMGVRECLTESAPQIMNNDRFYLLNSLTNDDGIALEEVYAFTRTKKLIEENPQIDHWLVCAPNDFQACHVATVLYDAKLSSNSAIVSTGAADMIKTWAGGTGISPMFESYVATLYTPYVIFAELIWCGLYAMMSGQATPEALWPDWLDTQDNPNNPNYAIRKLPVFIVDQENSQEFLAWVDSYAQTSSYREYF